MNRSLHVIICMTSIVLFSPATKSKHNHEITKGLAERVGLLLLIYEVYKPESLKQYWHVLISVNSL